MIRKYRIMFIVFVADWKKSWEETFANHISDNISQLHKGLRQHNSKNVHCENDQRIPPTDSSPGRTRRGQREHREARDAADPPGDADQIRGATPLPASRGDVIRKTSSSKCRRGRGERGPGGTPGGDADWCGRCGEQ